MGTRDVYLLDIQPAYYFRAQHSRNPRHRHHLTSHYVLWFTPPRLPRAQRVRSGTPLVETGALLALLAGHGILYPLIYCFSFTRV